MYFSPTVTGSSAFTGVSARAAAGGLLAAGGACSAAAGFVVPAAGAVGEVSAAVGASGVAANGADGFFGCTSVIAAAAGGCASGLCPDPPAPAGALTVLSVAAPVAAL